MSIFRERPPVARRKSPYEVLGLQHTASENDIKTTYRKLAKKLHPDVHPGDKEAEERFKHATAAYNLLSNPLNKERLDSGEIDADGNELPRFQNNQPYSMASELFSARPKENPITPLPGEKSDPDFLKRLKDRLSK